MAAPDASSQQTGASGAVRVASTKGAEAPRGGAGMASPDAPNLLTRRQPKTFAQHARTVSHVVLIVGIAAEILPGEFGIAEGEDIVVGTEGYGSGRTRVWHACHGGRCVGPHRP